MADIDIVAENLAELLTNTVDMTSVFYNIFLNPEPMMVHLKAFDKDNRLIDVEIPNRAQDRVVPYMGSGSPEGVQAAPIGSTYVDTTNSTVYYKVSGNATDPFGWNGVLSQSVMEVFIRTYLESRGYITYNILGTYIYNSVTQGQIPEGSTIKASTSTFGVAKLDGNTITTNSYDQLQANSLVDKNGGVMTRGIWVGVEDAYRTLYLSGSMNESDVYFLQDTGDLLVGRTLIANNSFPSNSRQTLTVPSSGSTINAVANGWFVLSETNAVAANDYISLVNIITLYTTNMYIPTVGSSGTVICPALKGEEVTIKYSGSSDTKSLIFIYAASSQVSYTAS